MVSLLTLKSLAFSVIGGIPRNASTGKEAQAPGFPAAAIAAFQPVAPFFQPAAVSIQPATAFFQQVSGETPSKLLAGWKTVGSETKAIESQAARAWPANRVHWLHGIEQRNTAPGPLSKPCDGALVAEAAADD
jgi:hypothetical protein